MKKTPYAVGSLLLVSLLVLAVGTGFGSHWKRQAQEDIEKADIVLVGRVIGLHREIKENIPEVTGYKRKYIFVYWYTVSVISVLGVDAGPKTFNLPVGVYFQDQPDDSDQFSRFNAVLSMELESAGLLSAGGIYVFCLNKCNKTCEEEFAFILPPHYDYHLRSAGYSVYPVEFKSGRYSRVCQFHNDKISFDEIVRRRQRTQ